MKVFELLRSIAIEKMIVPRHVLFLHLLQCTLGTLSRMRHDRWQITTPGTALEAVRCISDNRYLFRTSPAAENSGNRRRWNERASERTVARGTEARAERRDEEGAGNAGAGSPRCEKGSVVSASRFRPVIGSDSVLTLNVRARSPALMWQRIEGNRGRKGGGF